MEVGWKHILIINYICDLIIKKKKTRIKKLGSRLKFDFEFRLVGLNGGRMYIFDFISQIWLHLIPETLLLKIIMLFITIFIHCGYIVGKIYELKCKLKLNQILKAI